ncbi:uncharacterized protein F21D5.5 isoform X2 [Daktulosphaira vitifoliae]|uniref:uncharacterized protein F21D5.5 isoform X2 n=1 Tax=Daktulosphaira vitifoliae TaxID=58002 RepID=UPI0021A9A1BE|nr:uncharacterized protein F21D5.5 isoform X2 [Daktulosphaira vitifoliae]
MSKTQYNINNNINICVLVSELDSQQKIVLLDKEPIILGRTPQTGIIDRRLSKNQVKFEADYSTRHVIVEQIGNNKSAVNGESMMKGEKRLINHGDKVSLLHGSDYSYYLKFILPPDYGVSNPKKRVTEYYNNETFKKKKSTESQKWDTRNGALLIYTSEELIQKSKIAAFDMDGTIIATQSGKVYPVDFKDWKINFPEVTKTIRKLAEDGFKIVIFTNQGGIGKLKVDEKTFKTKIENITNVLKTPVQVFVSTHSDIYRKPAPGMWNIFVSEFNGDISIDMVNSFYCGDAAGRPNRIINKKNIKKDHSCCDRLFAMNIGLKFYTPEEYFWKKPTEDFNMPIFNPTSIMASVKYDDNQYNMSSNSKEIILMVGCPGSGKSYFVSNILATHESIKVINRDTLGSWQKCVLEAKQILECKNKSVVIDNTNPDKETRKRFIDIANNLNIPCRVFEMSTTKEHAKHNNKFRELTDEKHQKISDVIINMYLHWDFPCQN